MKKEILEKLNTLFLKTVKIDEKHTSIFIYRFIEKTDSNHSFIVLHPYYKGDKIVFQIIFKQLNALELNSLLPVKNIYDRLVVAPSKVMVDPKTSIGFVTIQKNVYVFYDKDIAEKNFARYKSYLDSKIKMFENEQEVKDNLFENFLKTTKVFDDDYILDFCTKIYNFHMEEINKFNSYENDVEKNLETYCYYIEKLKSITPEKDYNSLVESTFNEMLKDVKYISNSIETCKRKFSKEINVDVNNIEKLKNLSYDDKKYILIGNFQNLLDFDVETAKDTVYNELNALYPYILRFLKNKGIIDEKTKFVGEKYKKLKEEEGKDFSKLN